MPRSAAVVVPLVLRTNQILAALPSEEVEVVRSRLEPVDLSLRLNLYEANRPVDHVYFIHRGVASMLTTMPDGTSVEFATVGPEGMVGLPIFLGAERIVSQAFIQVPGEGARMEAGAFRQIIGRCPALNRMLLRYTLALMTQMAQNTACNRAHSIEERCARWLLMTQDRVHRPSFPLTQEFLAQMLGVRRPTVSVAANMLAKAGLISYVRGHITVVDRLGLEAAACECYRIIVGEFTHLISDQTDPAQPGAGGEASGR